MRQAMVPVEHAVDAAFKYLVAAAELLCLIWHIVWRFDQSQFPLTSAHERGPEPTPNWMLLVRC